MRKIVTLSALLLTCLGTQAQHANPLSGKGPKNVPASHKITAADTRLVATATSKRDGNSMVPTDSTIAWYTGNNGWDAVTGGWKSDSSFSWRYIPFGAVWMDDGKGYQQLASNRIVSTEYKAWTGSTWEDNSKTEYTYTTNGQIATLAYYYDNGAGIEPVSKMTYSYNGDKLVVETVSETWNSVKGVMEPFSRTLSFYNNNKQLDTMIQQSWNTTTNQWQDQMRNLYTYTSGYLTFLLQEVQMNGAWTNMYRTNYTNDSKGNTVIIEPEDWNFLVGKWNKVARTEQAFDVNNDIAEQKSAMWDGSAFVYTTKTTTTYNQHRHVLTEETQTWDDNNNQWISANGDVHTRYYYEPYTNSVKTVATNIAQLNIFPVPAKDAITISAALKQAQPVQVTLTDMSGRVVKQYAEQGGTQYRKTLSVTDIPAGHYLVQMNGTKEQAVQTITITH